MGFYLNKSLIVFIESCTIVHQPHYTYKMSTNRKIAVMGYKSVGKSSIVIQFVDNKFVSGYDPTIENTFQTSLKNRNQQFELELIDTAGQVSSPKCCTEVMLVVSPVTNKTSHVQDEYSLFPDSYALDIH